MAHDSSRAITPYRRGHRINLTDTHIASRESYYAESLGNSYSQSPERYKEIRRERDRVHGTSPTVSWVSESRHAAHQAVDDAAQMRNISTTVYMAGADTTVDNRQTMRFIEGANATSHMINGSLHTMLQEADSYREWMVSDILRALVRNNKDE